MQNEDLQIESIKTLDLVKPEAEVQQIKFLVEILGRFLLCIG